MGVFVRYDYDSAQHFLMTPIKDLREMEKGKVYWTQTQISSLEDFQYCFPF